MKKSEYDAMRDRHMDRLLLLSSMDFNLFVHPKSPGLEINPVPKQWLSAWRDDTAKLLEEVAVEILTTEQNLD